MQTKSFPKKIDKFSASPVGDKKEYDAACQHSVRNRQAVTKTAQQTPQTEISNSSSGNRSLYRAKSAKQDEFYTQLGDISNELKHYKGQLRGKTILCNCDNTFERYLYLKKRKFFTCIEDVEDCFSTSYLDDVRPNAVALHFAEQKKKATKLQVRRELRDRAFWVIDNSFDDCPLTRKEMKELARKWADSVLRRTMSMIAFYR